MLALGSGARTNVMQFYCVSLATVECIGRGADQTIFATHAIGKHSKSKMKWTITIKNNWITYDVYTINGLRHFRRWRPFCHFKPPFMWAHCVIAYTHYLLLTTQIYYYYYSIKINENANRIIFGASVWCSNRFDEYKFDASVHHHTTVFRTSV